METSASDCPAHSYLPAWTGQQKKKKKKDPREKKYGRNRERPIGEKGKKGDRSVGEKNATLT